MAIDDFYYESYPFNIRPQFKSPRPKNIIVQKLRCPPDSSLQAIVVRNAKLGVIQGWEWKSILDLSNFFDPINVYLTAEIVVPYLQDPITNEWEIYHPQDYHQQDYVVLDYGFLKNQFGKVSFIALYPLYHQLKETNQDKWYLKFRFQGETEWRTLGRIFVWSSSNQDGIKPIEFKNDIGEDVFIKILIAN